MVKSKALFALVLLLLFTTLFAVTNESEGKVILKVFDLPDPRDSSPYSKANLAVVRAFQKKYPHIDLRSYSGIKIENMDLDAGPLMAIAGGVSPDIIYVNFRQSATYIENGFLYPLDEYVSRLTEQDLELRIEKPVMPVIRRKKYGDDEEHYWCMPYETLVRVMMYRKDFFGRVGLDPNKPPADWDELLSYARQMTIPEEGTFGMFLASGPQAAYDWITYLWSAGGEAVEQDPETGEWLAAFNSAAGVTAMEFYLKLLTTKWTDSQGNPQQGFVIREGEWGRKWDEGKIGIRMGYMNQQSLGGNLDPNLFGLAPCPMGPTGLRGSEINCRMMGIFAGAGESNNAGLGERDPEEVREAAFNYIWFFDSEEARQIRLKVMINAGYGRMQNPIYLKRYGYEEYLKYTPPGWLETFEQAIKNGKPEPYGRNTQKVYEFMTVPVEKCISLEEDGKLGNTNAEKRLKIRELLDKGAERTNKEMIGKISSEERKRRNNVAVVVAIIIFAAFIAGIIHIWRYFTPDNKYVNKNKKRNWLPYLMILPAIASIILWKYLPVIMGSLMAFQDYQIVGQSEWVGLQNFADVLFDPVWWSSLGKTLIYMTLSLGLGFIPPIVLAVMLQEVSHGKLIYRVIYYLPAVVSGVIVIYLWKLLYDPSDAGGLNQILMSLGLEKSRWIRDENLAMICTVIPSIWAGVGPGCLIYLAALKGIPDDLYDAADIDGTNFFQKLAFIVVPSLKALIIMQFIAAFIASAQQSGFILVMTFGGPNEATKVADLLIFERAYLYLKFGIATTMAWMLGMMLMGFTILQLKKLKNMEFRTVDSDKN
ncbi:MAG: extracellular solute-binding protein [Candidatus Zophobacter franzmannii]|nr:extracellular solute-binding protein [Candidatus Zophobacter franzmannii]